MLEGIIVGGTQVWDIEGQQKAFDGSKYKEVDFLEEWNGQQYKMQKKCQVKHGWKDDHWICLCGGQ